MNWYEVDYRHDWLSVTLEALQFGFGAIEKMSEEVPWFDGLWQLEYIENILGIAFVAAQVYIVGTVEDMNKIRESDGKTQLDKIKYFSDDAQPLLNGVSRILLIHALANYYKHHDEWDSWQVGHTTRTLAEIGILEGTDFPCYEGATKLWDENPCENLGHLLSIISEWRKYILAKYM